MERVESEVRRWGAVSEWAVMAFLSWVSLRLAHGRREALGDLAVLADPWEWSLRVKVWLGLMAAALISSREARANQAYWQGQARRIAEQEK